MVRLPIDHSVLNPIEHIWALIKNSVARENTTFKIADVKRLVEEAIAHVTPKDWENCVKHSRKVEDAFRRIDGVDAPEIDPIIITLSNGNESSEEETEFLRETDDDDDE